METRILIPEALSIVTSSKSYGNFHESTNKDVKKTKRHEDEDEGDVKHNVGAIATSSNDRDEEEIEKPTSSSGCIEEIIRDELYSNNSTSISTSSNSSDDVILPLPSRDSNSSCGSGSDTNSHHSLQSVVSSGGVTTGAKRHKKCSVSNSSGVLRKVDEEDIHSDSNDIVSSADSKINANNNKYAQKQDVSNSTESMCNNNQKKKQFVKICANQRIERGTVFSPNDGEVRVVYLTKGVSQVPPDDIRFVFGCFDRIVDDPLDDDKEIRLCNWIRFVKRAKDKYQEGVNVVARFADRQPVFELTRTLLPGTELLIFFDIESITQMNDRAIMEEKNNSDNRDILKTAVGFKPDGPLDLSKSPLEKPKSKPVSDFPHSHSPTSSLLLAPEKSISFSSIKTSNKSPTIFSISNVLQPIKLFQPYSISHNHHHHHHHTRNSRNDYSRTLFSTHANGGHTLGSHSTNSTSSTNGLLATTPSSIGSSSPSATNSPTLRPILRTRGRERSLLPCDVCGKAFDRPSLLKRHMRTHTGEKPHICDVCSKGFSTSSSLNTHRRIHSGEKPHQCPICGKRFTASSNLYYHRMTHNKEKPHKCLLCGKSFPTPGDLKSHQYVHSGSWPYNCPICHRGFSKQTNLRNHLLLHSGDKPHNCQICGKKFALACNLRAHLRTHEEDPISSCVSCKRTFLSSLNMLVNGQCRSCLLLHQQQNLSTSLTCSNNSSGGGGGTQANKNSGVMSVDLIPVTSNHNSLSSNHVHSLTTSPSSINAAVSPDVSHTLSSITGLQVPTAAIAPLPGFLPTSHSSVPFFHGSITEGISSFNRPNPFLEQLFEWNYRFAKETAGNLGLHFQQKLLESQMLAAQLMSVSNSQGMSNIGLGISDILRLRSQEFSSIDVAGVNKFVQQ